MADAVVRHVVAVTEAEVRRRIADASDVTVRFASVAPLATLAGCTTPLEVDLQQQRPAGNVALRVRCAANGRAVSLPASVEARVPVVVARRTLLRESIVAAGDVEVRAVPYSPAPRIVRLEDVVGARVRLAIREGAALQPRHIESAKAVSAGQQLVLRGGEGALVVSTTAEALADGAVGEQIRVRNLSSGKVLAAWVTAPGAASTRPPPMGPARTAH